LIIDPGRLHLHTELAKVYQTLKRYSDAEQMLKESLAIEPNQVHPRTELARVYIKQGLFRRARAEVFAFLKKNPNENSEDIAHLILAHLNACFLMRRFQEGIELVDKLGCQFVSPELAEEYGRLMKNYDLENAVSFFGTAAFFFNDASRLLSEAAICFKLAGRDDAEIILARAIELAPDREEKYRRLYEIARTPRQIAFADVDLSGHVESISQSMYFDHPSIEGRLEAENRTYGFRVTRYLDELFSKLRVNDPVLFDVTERGYAVNIEPEF
jgi:tetratricopeptide (TPR) repeat protein